MEAYILPVLLIITGYSVFVQMQIIRGLINENRNLRNLEKHQNEVFSREQKRSRKLRQKSEQFICLVNECIKKWKSNGEYTIANEINQKLATIIVEGEEYNEQK